MKMKKICHGTRVQNENNATASTVNESIFTDLDF